MFVVVVVCLLLSCKHQEDKDQVQRGHDRLSSQLDSLTQECSDARDVAQSQEQRLHVECQASVVQAQARNSQLQKDADSCRSSLAAASAGTSRCSDEVRQCVCCVPISGRLAATSLSGLDVWNPEMSYVGHFCIVHPNFTSDLGHLK